LVVPGGVEDELAEEFAGGGVDDFDVEVLGEDQDAGSVVDAADADVVQAPAHGQGDGAGLVDAVGADGVVGVGAGSRGCFQACGGGRRMLNASLCERRDSL
jgi:hypothetical protein